LGETSYCEKSHLTLFLITLFSPGERRIFVSLLQ